MIIFKSTTAGIKRVGFSSPLYSIFLSALLFIGCKDSKPTGLLVMCGAANKPPMEEIAVRFQKQTGDPVRLILGGSGSLLSQMKISRHGDIYLPGSPDYILKAKQMRQIHPDTVRRVAYLIPAIVVPRGNPAGIKRLKDLARPGLRIGMGNPETVCLGLYGIELLEYNRLLEPVLKNVVTHGASCSKTANLAAMGQVDAILGWRVFQHWNPGKMQYILPDKKEIPRISYIPIAVSIHTRNRALAEEFIKFVLSKKGRAIYRKWGYISDRDEALRYSASGKIGGLYTLPDAYYRLSGLR